jgi:5,10-methylenetetrahydromethanopterin reductase
MGGIKLSVGMPPGPQVVEYAQLAHDLGYDRIWLYDSAALYQDVWIWLARIADRTSIKIGTAVLVPNLRHVMTTASAIATIEHLAPGRLACGFGTGATARWVLGQPALTWAATRRYVEQLRSLLAAEVVEIDGAKTQMIHHDELAPPRPIRTPLLLSAIGPKGRQIAHEIADGIMTIGGGVDDMDWHVQMTSGTVLDDGEDLESPRAKDALGPWFTVAYHGAWQSSLSQSGGAAVDNLPLGAEWRDAIEAERPDGERHLAVHEGHVSHVTPRDRKLVDQAGPLISMMGWVGSAPQIREKAEAAMAAGATELLYTPAGPDVPREMRAWAAALS